MFFLVSSQLDFCSFWLTKNFLVEKKFFGKIKNKSFMMIVLGEQVVGETSFVASTVTTVSTVSTVSTVTTIT